MTKFEDSQRETYLRENTFLESIKEKLKKRVDEVNKGLRSGQKEVEQMHEYYWQNYTEMDQYGYEDYDNQQALLIQVNANQEQLVMKQRLERMLEAPYFGRVDFRFEGEENPETFYIGISNFSEAVGKMPLIYDWRAPISGLFYDYDQGAASYEAPTGMINGEITSKWQYKIKKGKLVYALESDTKIDDEILKAELSTSGDVQLKNIIRTIQKEQNAIIRNRTDRILVIQGAAGSGKTSIALHRIAYLLYHERGRLKSSNVLILSPNGVFSDYISHILPELGEENIQEMSFDLFAYRELRDVVEDCENRYDYLEAQMLDKNPETERRCKEKQSEWLVGEMEGFLAGLEDQLMNFGKIEYKGFCKTEQELIDLFYFKFSGTPLLKRMDEVMEYFVDEYETLRQRDLSGEEKELLHEKFDQFYVTKDIYEIYNWFLEALGYPLLETAEYEKRKLAYEDVYPMLYLKYRLTGKSVNQQIRHLVVDEMQDYSYLQYVLLKELFSCRMTILGDKAQTLGDEMQDVLTFLPRILGKDIRKIIINKSYRNTREIAEYAAGLTGVSDVAMLERHGKAVTEKVFTDVKALAGEVLKQQQVRSEDVYETAAVLALTEKDAFDLYLELKRQLRETETELHYMDQNSSSFKKGLTVTTWYLAKGLEFDQVFGCFAADIAAPYQQQAKYICATRALHELYMYTF